MLSIFQIAPALNIFDITLFNRATDFSLPGILIMMTTSFFLGLFILLIYKKSFTGVMYNTSFGVTMITMTLVTTFVIIAITSNLILSLGMVGALSIVRFRTALKDPLDLAFLFWSISVGIVVGAGLIFVALIGSALVGATLYVFADYRNTRPADAPYILVLNLENDQSEEEAMNILKSGAKKQLIKSKTVSKSGIELTIEVCLNQKSTVVVNDLLKVSGVVNAVLVSYNGDFGA